MTDTFYRRRGKRLLDLALTLPATVVLLPLGLVLAAAVRLALGTPVLFRQRRPGLGGAPFELLKFRTMSGARDEHGVLLPDARRLTRFGRALRRTSLDELPELVNVLRGEMSLVGPRPLLMQYLERYSPEQARRHDVRPGLTGWAQVRGRNALSWPEKLACDTWYVDHLSLPLDLRILAATVLQVLRGTGISAAGHDTMPELTGREVETGDREVRDREASELEGREAAGEGSARTFPAGRAEPFPAAAPGPRSEDSGRAER